MKAARIIAMGLAAFSLTGANLPQFASPGYVPEDKDERGLWMQAEEYERELKHSQFVMRDAALNAWMRDLFCRTVGEAECKDVRIYILRTPFFNASMFPNGMMQVWSGLFLRTRNEAQLAAILGHEYTHYRNRHSIQGFRDAKSKLGALSFLAFLDGGLLTGPALLGGYFANSRGMESEADAGSVPMLARAGYSPHAAGKVWEQLRAEMDATALARNKKSRKDKDRGMFATHPPTAERMTELKALADKQAVTVPIDDRRGPYMAALAPFWASLVDDQIKLNDFGATEFLLGQLALDGWTPELLFARGELYRARGKPGDFDTAAGFYREAVKSDEAPAEAWRGLGLSLMRAGKPDEGKLAIKAYLDLAPRATDRAMMAMIAGVTQ